MLSEGKHSGRATLVFLGSIFGTIAVSVVACLIIAITLVWLAHHWSHSPWLLAAIGLGMIGMVVAVVWRWWRLPAERRFRFSLRGMLVGITVFALWLGVIGVDLLRWGRQATAVVQLYGHGIILPSATLMVPFRDMTGVDVRADAGISALLDHAGSFAGLQWADFRGGGVTDAGLVRVAELERFPKLRSVAFSNCNITDAGLERLAEWKALEEVTFLGCGKITDAGLQHLVDLPRLREVNLMSPSISDGGIAWLQSMPNLQRVHLHETKATEAGVHALYEALPDCFVTWDRASFPGVGQIRQIEVWTKDGNERQLAAIGDRERVAPIKEWFEQYMQRVRNGVWRCDFAEDRGKTRLSVRFEGGHRRLCEIELGNGVYLSPWGGAQTMSSVDDEEIRTLLGVDVTDWHFGGAVE